MTSPIAEQARTKDDTDYWRRITQEANVKNSSEGRIEPSHPTDSVSQDINSDADLLPCPLAHEVIKGLHVSSSSGMRKWHLTCFDCGLVLEGQLDGTARQLFTRWNTRAHTPAVGDYAQQAQDIVDGARFLGENVGPDEFDSERLIADFTTALQAAAGENERSRKLGMTPEVAVKLLNVREALAKSDIEDAWFWLYKIANANMDSLTPWTELESLAAIAAEGK